MQRVNKTKVGALYFGVDTAVAAAGADGVVRFSVTVHATGSRGAGATIAVALTVTGAALPAHGDRDSWRLARLRWLDSVDGRDDSVSAGFLPVRVSTSPGRGDPGGGGGGGGGGEATLSKTFAVDILDRTITIDRSTGLPTSLVSNGREILAAPIVFTATTAAGKDLQCRAAGTDAMATPQQFGQGRVTWSVAAPCGGSSGLTVQLVATLTYEGYLNLVATVDNSAANSEAVALSDFRLVVIYRKEVARFGMGIGMISGDRPAAIAWSWDQYGSYCTQPTDPTKGAFSDIVPQVWLGTPDAGLRVALKGADPEWDSPEDYPKVPTASAFANCRPGPNASARPVCSGTVSLSEVPAPLDDAGGTSGVRYTASLGAVEFAKGANVPFHFDLLTTPLKPVNMSQHFDTRYFHFGEQMPMPDSNLTLEESVAQIKELGVTWVVIHQVRPR